MIPSYTYRRSAAAGSLRLPARGFIVLAAICMMFCAAPLAAQIQIVSPADSSVSELRNQAITVRTMAGFTTALYVNGKEVRTAKPLPNGVIDFINVELPEGDVTLDAKVLNPDGSEVMNDVKTIHILGAPASLKIELDRSAVHADGRSPVKGTVRVYDKWNYPILKDVTVSVAADSGRIVTQDMDSTARETQLRFKDGVAEFEYQPGTHAGGARITARAGSAAALAEVAMTTPLEPMTITGIVDGTGIASSRKGDPSGLADEGSFPDKLNAHGRAAVYARGTVFSDWLLTGSLDTDRKNRSKLFKEIDPDYLYSIYGDNSMLSYDAQTNQNFFLRLEKNQTYVYLGDFNTELTRQELTSYNRTFNGVKAAYRDRKLNVTGFGTLTNRKVVQKELRGEGLSGYYNVGSTHITPGSEKIRVETRDRYHSEVLLRVQDKQRFTDYDIDYDQGTVFFKQPVPAVDNMDNPMYIVVSYEALSEEADVYIGGGRVEYAPVDGLVLGATGVTEERDPQNFNLMGADAKYQLGSKFMAAGEGARSTYLGGSGNAYKIESNLTPADWLGVKGYYRQVESGFMNPTMSGGRAELGSEKYGAGTFVKPFSTTKMDLDYYRSRQQMNVAGQAVVTSLSGGIDQQFMNELTGSVRVENLEYEGPDPQPSRPALSRHSTLATGKFNYQITPDLTVALQHEQNIGPDQDAAKPNGTSVLADYRITRGIALQAAEKFFSDGGNMASVGLTSTVMEGTTVNAKYEISNAIGNERNMMSIGLQNILKLPYDLTASFGYERTKSLARRLAETPTQDHSAYTVGLEYLPKDGPVKATGKAEYGEEDDRSKKINLYFGGDYRFRRDMSLIVKYTSSDEQRFGAGYQFRYHLITGAAFRPVDFDWFNAVGKFEIKRDNNHYLTPWSDYASSIASVHAFFEPVRRIELGVKYAFKRATENADVFSASTHTHFILGRVEADLTEIFDVAAEYRLLAQVEAGDRLDGYSAEIGCAAVRNLRVAAGFNFKGYKERDLVDYTLWSRGPYLSMKFKFTEELFGLGGE